MGIFGVAGVVPEPEGEVETAGEDGSSEAGDQRVPPECEYPGPHGGYLPGTTRRPLARTSSTERTAGLPGASSDRLPQLPHATTHHACHGTPQAADPLTGHFAGPSVILHRRSKAQGQGTCRVDHQGAADGVKHVDFYHGVAGRMDSCASLKRIVIV